MKVGEFRFRIWMFALFVLFSFSFFLERRSKVEDQKRFGTEDGKMLETNILDLNLGLFIDTILYRDKSRRSWKK